MHHRVVHLSVGTLFVSGLFLPGSSFAAPAPATCPNGTPIAASTICTLPVDVANINVQAWGGGGGGGSGNGARGGGGGGSYCGATNIPVVSSQSLTVTIGSGGSVGNAGGTTSVTGNGVSGIVANGGAAGGNPSGGSGGATSGCTYSGATKYSGGNGGKKGTNTVPVLGTTVDAAGGGGGGSATASANGGNGGNPTNRVIGQITIPEVVGGTGGTGQGNGGKGGDAFGGGDANGVAGVAPGGGGGGRAVATGIVTRTSGTGASGQVTISYTPLPRAASGNAGGGEVLATITGGNCAGFQSTSFAAPTNHPPLTIFPYGTFGFTAIGCPTTGGSITITLTYPNDLPKETVYWKNINGQWVDWTKKVVISGKTVQLTITDGGDGDTNPAAGVIGDPSGPGLNSASTIPTMQQWALVLMGLLLSALAWRQTRRSEG